MNRFLLSLLCATTLASPIMAQQPPADPFIKGTMNIDFGTITQADKDGNPPVGASDVYTLSLNVADSAHFHGTITHLPYVHKTFGASQDGSLSFNLAYDVVNPRKVSQTRNIGQISGDVPVDRLNVYHFDAGNAGVKTFAVGMAAPIDSRFTGTAIGKPPATPANILQRLKNQAITITRSVHGQVSKIVVTNYDRMDLNGLVLPAGPGYPEVSVGGALVFDYSRNAWHFVNVTCTYPGGRAGGDTLSGDIRWVPDAARGQNGNGEYDFDVRVNEPPPSESAVFAPATTDADFFATDDSVAGLTGTMRYHDTFSSSSSPDDLKGTADNANVAASAVTIDLVGSHLSKQEVMLLTKLLLFTAVVPMNSN